MRIICISRGSDSSGKELAAELARKLDWPCLSRETIVDAAIKEGIAVGKLEAAMLKPGRIGERLLAERDYYQAFATDFLCSKAEASNLVYHGRTGHLLLPGISHMLRLRVVKNMEARINSVVMRLGIPWKKAREYIEAVDEDRRLWSRSLYNREWDENQEYDLIVNLENMACNNAAAALVAMASLPDFQPTPASEQALANLHLAARVRLAMCRDKRLDEVLVKVTADRGDVLVSYQPRDVSVGQYIPEVVEKVEGVRHVQCTMAASTILWVQERFQARSDTYEQITSLARSWNAAVELLRYVAVEENGDACEETPTPEAGPDAAVEDQPAAAEAEKSDAAGAEYNGGIEDDVPGEPADEDGGMSATHAALAADALAGRARAVRQPPPDFIERLDGREKYSLVVLGEVFCDKGHAAQVRRTRELAAGINEALKVPLVEAADLKKTFGFTVGQAFKVLFFLVLVAAVLAAVFFNEEAVAQNLRQDETLYKVLVAAGVFALVPTFAYLWGSVTGKLLELAGIK